MTNYRVRTRPCRWCRELFSDRGLYVFCSNECGDLWRADRATSLTPHERLKRRVARAMVRTEVDQKRLRPLPCEVGVGCSGVIDAHHNDYDQPLSVRWLCRRHHHQLHTEQRTQARRASVRQLSLATANRKAPESSGAEPSVTQ